MLPANKTTTCRDEIERVREPLQAQRHTWSNAHDLGSPQETEHSGLDLRLVAEQKVKLSHPVVDYSCSPCQTKYTWEDSFTVWDRNLVTRPLKQEADPTA